MKTSFQEFIQFYKANNPLNSHGRLGRLDIIFWSFYAPFLLMIVTYSTIIFILVEAWWSAAQNILNYVLFIFWVMVIICVVLMGWGSDIRRLHDLNLSGTWLLLYFVPLVNIFFVIYLLFAPGTKGENTYGLPYQTPKWERITLISCILIQVITIVIFIVVWWLLWLLWQNDESTNNHKEETTIATTEKIVNWSPYKVKEGSFQIDFPNNKVDFYNSTEKISDDDTITSLSYASDLWDSVYGVVEYSTDNFAIDGEKIWVFPPVVIEGILGIKSKDQKSENKTTSELEIHRISGKIAKFEYKQNLIFNDKAYIIEGIVLSTHEKKVYNMYVLYPTINNTVETKRFFDSFKIMP